MELSLAKAEEERAKVLNEQKKAIQRARSAAAAATERSNDSNK